MSQPLFFLHIPKTAGTTLNAILDDNFAGQPVLDVYTESQQRRLKETTYAQIAQYALVRGHMFISDFRDILDGPVRFRVFTFLRDPVNRVVSEYHFLRTWPKSHLYRFLNEHDVSLAEYVTSQRPELRARGCNAMVNSLCGVGAPTVEERLERAWHHLRERFVFFGILERFDESVLLLNTTLDLARSFYEKQNVRARQGVRPVSGADMELIREHNQADITLYDRACREFDARIRGLGAPFQAELRLFTRVNEGFQRVASLINERDGVQSGQLLNAK